MALETSVLNDSVIRQLLKEHYNLVVDEISKMSLGTANCYRISSSEKNYFLKEFQSGFSKDDLDREAMLVNFLDSHHFPTAKILLTNDQNTSITYQEHLLCLQEYIEGTTYGNNQLPHRLLMQAAELLGQLHTLLKDYPLPVEMDVPWLEAFSAENCAPQYDNLLHAAEQNPSDPNYERIKADLLYKKELAYRIAEYKKYYNGITYNATHGDYTEFQYICDGDRIKAVIDFSAAKTLPVVWEIMRSYIQSCGACKDGNNLDVQDFCCYVRSYMKYAPLTKADLQAMPYVYLHQLARSQYGYKQYLIKKSENKDDLLQFAFWRTDICREIEAKAAEISRELLNVSF